MDSPFLLVRKIKTHSRDLQSDEDAEQLRQVSQRSYYRQTNFLLSKTTAYYSDNE